MAKTVPLDATTLAWAREGFARYYATAPIAPPERLARREFAAFPFAETTGMRRHATLPTPERLAQYLRETVPRHVYYSSAYYRAPAEPTMAAKGWLGADLIFDLDSDHLRGAEALDYAGQLELVKRRLLDLVDDFLVRDFGIDPVATSFVFSGGRGYHVHIRDERFIPLTSPERREIVDYVLGTGVNAWALQEWEIQDVRSGRVMGDADIAELEISRERPIKSIQLPPENAPGWKGHATNAILSALSRWQSAGEAVATKEITEMGVAPTQARKWARALLKESRIQKIREKLVLDVFGPRENPWPFLESIIRESGMRIQAETDAPVTTDIHRLIRLPGSLHGGTGLRVVPLTRDGVPDFNPFRDATVAGEEGSTAITYRSDVRYPFPPDGLHGTPGRDDELPTPLARFLVLRGEATLRPSPAG